MLIFTRTGPTTTVGMLEVLSGILQKEQLFGLWKGMTPVSYRNFC